MQVHITSVPVIILSSTFFFIVAIPWASVCLQNPTDIVKDTMTALGSSAESYLVDMRSATGSKIKINVRVQMCNNDLSTSNGCGFYFRVDGHSGGTDRDFFPRPQLYVCGQDVYRMRLTLLGGTYEDQLCLGDNEKAKQVELHADGWHDTSVGTVCIGFDQRVIGVGGGSRTFCINSRVLRACKLLASKWDDIDVGHDCIVMTRTARGVHKIVFRNINAIVDSFERLVRVKDDAEALSAMCDHIDLVKGDYNEVYNTCPAEKRYATRLHYSNVLASNVVWEFRNTEKNPNVGCFTSTK